MTAREHYALHRGLVTLVHIGDYPGCSFATDMYLMSILSGKVFWGCKGVLFLVRRQKVNNLVVVVFVISEREVASLVARYPLVMEKGNFVVSSSVPPSLLGLCFVNVTVRLLITCRCLVSIGGESMRVRNM
jgi:hypothetical protein